MGSGGNNNGNVRTPLGVKNVGINNNVNSVGVSSKNSNNMIMSGSSNKRVYGCREIVQIQGGNKGTLLCIRLDNSNQEDRYNSAILIITRLS